MKTATADTAEFITTEVIGNFLQTTADEMTLSCLRAAYSPNIKERWDICAAIFDTEGNVVSLASYVPMHLGSMTGNVQYLRKRYPLETLRPGDVFVANDPYEGGGTHLPDIGLTAPVFIGRTFLGFVSIVGHHADLGGSVAGSSSAKSISVFEEGLRLPVIRIQEAGRLIQDVVDVIALNSRIPTDREGDLRAQMGSLNVGLRNLNELCRRYPTDRVRQAMAELLNYSEKRFRSAIGRLRRGEWSYTDYLDDNGTGGPPVPIRATVRVGDGEVEVDFTGTGDQVESAFNIPWSGTLATVYYALKAFIDPGVPPNSGYWRAIRVVGPLGSLVNPHPPAAISIRANTCQVLADAIFGALSEADPEHAFAGCGSHLGLQLGGKDPRTGRYFVHNENVAPGWGASADHDGMDAVHVHITNTSNIPIEASEHEYPLEYLVYTLNPASAGWGRFRGGFGMRRDVKILADGARFTLRANRYRIPAPGRAGGEDGAHGEVVINPDTPAERRLEWTASDEVLAKGDVVSIRTSGGGGYGRPEERNRELRERDELEGKTR